jgi:protease-4
MGAADKILEQRVLSKKLLFWRAAAIVAIVIMFFLVYSKGSTLKQSQYIASISVVGEIFEDGIREKNLAKIANDPQIKAVIFNISSPGGSSYGGESLYSSILEIGKKKPVVAVMGTMATSAGYMAALGANHIIARNSTVTASIGTIFIYPEFSELAKKLGVQVVVLKKGKLKAEPLPFNGPITPEAKQMITSLLEDQYNMFYDMVARHRKIPRNKLEALSDGRVLTGSQALSYGLIDQIGANKEAIAWLNSQNKRLKNLKVKEIPLYEARKMFGFDDLKSMLVNLKDILRMFANSSTGQVQS